MKKGYILDMEDNNVRAALTKISERIPCFIWEEAETIMIECRDADIIFVEKILAPYV